METEVKMNLPAKLAFLRKETGFTQMELAEKLKVSRQAISKWEVGTAVPSTDNLKVLSDLYGVSVDYLLNNDSENDSKIPEHPAPVPSLQRTKSEGTKTMVTIACAVAIAVVAIIFAFAFREPKQEQEQITPIENLVSEKIENDVTNTFRLE